MMKLVDFKKNLNINFEIYIEGTVIIIRMHTGSLFEPSQNGCPISKSKLLGYYSILNFALDLTKTIQKKMVVNNAT
jgi:hypothetical protein